MMLWVHYACNTLAIKCFFYSKTFFSGKIFTLKSKENKFCGILDGKCFCLAKYSCIIICWFIENSSTEFSKRTSMGRFGGSWNSCSFEFHSIPGELLKFKIKTNLLKRVNSCNNKQFFPWKWGWIKDKRILLLLKCQFIYYGVFLYLIFIFFASLLQIFIRMFVSSMIYECF